MSARWLVVPAALAVAVTSCGDDGGNQLPARPTTSVTAASAAATVPPDVGTTTTAAAATTQPSTTTAATTTTVAPARGAGIDMAVIEAAIAAADTAPPLDSLPARDWTAGARLAGELTGVGST